MSDEADGPLRPGLRMIAGGSLTFPPGSLVMTLDDEGNPTSLEVHGFLVTASTWPDWLDIALEQLEVAKAARRDLAAATAAGSEDDENAAVQREVRAALQTISAAVFALDGLYGQLQPHVNVAPDERERRREKQVGRATWVYDAIFRVAKIPNQAKKALRTNIKTCYAVRDQAVHPEHLARPPGIHPGLRQMVPAHIALFCLETARSIFAICSEAIMWVTDHPQASEGAIFDLAQWASPRLHQLVDPHLTYAPGSGLGPRSSSPTDSR